MSVVSQAGPVFNLARRRLKKPRDSGLVGFVRHGDTGVAAVQIHHGARA